jgi:hypothetical protein
MNNHMLNLDLSKHVYETCKPYIVEKECYVNIFHTIGFFPQKFRTREWKIAYGYIRVLEGNNLMARHCFIVNEQNEAIDPTLVNLKFFRIDDNRGHTSFAIFDNLSEYLNALKSNNNKPDLIKPLTRVEKVTSEIWAKENEYFLLR